MGAAGVLTALFYFQFYSDMLQYLVIILKTIATDCMSWVAQSV
jgi:hypothetical protein